MEMKPQYFESLPPYGYNTSALFPFELNFAFPAFHCRCMRATEETVARMIIRDVLNFPPDI